MGHRDPGGREGHPAPGPTEANRGGGSDPLRKRYQGISGLFGLLGLVMVGQKFLFPWFPKQRLPAPWETIYFLSLFAVAVGIVFLVVAVYAGLRSGLRHPTKGRGLASRRDFRHWQSRRR